MDVRKTLSATIRDGRLYIPLGRVPETELMEREYPGVPRVFLAKTTA
jgi:hypothetical protein